MRFQRLPCCPLRELIAPTLLSVLQVCVFHAHLGRALSYELSHLVLQQPRLLHGPTRQNQTQKRYIA